MKEGKVTKAMKRTIRAHNFYDMGEALGFESMVSETQWRDALRSCKGTADRNALRDGFIAARMAGGSSYDAARRKFYREAALYAPESSNRQAKANAAKAAAKEAEADGDADDADIGGDAAKVTRLSEKQLARNVLQATAFLAAWQAGEADAGTLGRIGELLAILSNAK